MSGAVKVILTIFVLGAVLFLYRQMATDQRNRAAAIKSVEALTGGPANHGEVGYRPNNVTRER